MRGSRGCTGQADSRETVQATGRGLFRIAGALILLLVAAGAAFVYLRQNVAARVGTDIIWQADVERRMADLAESTGLSLEENREILQEMALEAELHDRVWEQIFRDYGIQERGAAGQEALRARLAAEAEVTEEEILARAEAHAVGAVLVPERVVVRMILLPSLAEAEAALAELGRAPAEAQVAALAESRSLDAATREQGGLLPPIERGMMEPAVADLLFATPVGEVTAPIPWGNGYALFWIRERQEEQRMTEEQARALAIAQIRAEKAAARFNEIVQRYFAEARRVGAGN